MSIPLRAHYLRLKRPFPGALLFFRLGDFYELYDEDAMAVARELDLTVSVREFSRSERVPMCPIPYHTVDGHVRRLVSRGYIVAVCEQIGDPCRTGGIVQREVVRIITPTAAMVEGTPVMPDDNGDPAPCEPGGAIAPPPTPDTSMSLPLIAATPEGSLSGEETTTQMVVQLSLFDASVASPTVVASVPAPAPTDNPDPVQMGLF